jgi:hypothetical protein
LRCIHPHLPLLHPARADDDSPVVLWRSPHAYPGFIV